MNGIQLQMIYSFLEFQIRLSLTDFSVNQQSNTVGWFTKFPKGEN